MSIEIIIKCLVMFLFVFRVKGDDRFGVIFKRLKIGLWRLRDYREVYSVFVCIYFLGKG